MSFRTPLRYPGGKSQLGPWLALILAENDLDGGTYVEPYAGGCGAALHLLLTGAVDRIVVNDADPAIYALWRCVVNDAERLCDRIRTCEISIEEWWRQRAVLSSPQNHKTHELGFAAFFLNRTNRSGILSAGVIGGKAQSGKYKLDARFNRPDLIDRIENIHAQRDRIDVVGEDALALLKRLAPMLSTRSLVYLDPPYYEKGALLYRNFYGPADHQSVSNFITELKTPWLVTYDDCAAIEDLYSGTKSLRYSPYYSTHVARVRRTELMFYGGLDISTPPFLKRANPRSQVRTESRPAGE